MPVGKAEPLVDVEHRGTRDLGQRYGGLGAVRAPVSDFGVQRTTSGSPLTCFNAVHHFDLARFASEASRVLSPSGLLVLYTRTAAQNRDTIWGRYFPEFAELETRLYSVSELQAALHATDAFASVRVQTIPWRVTTSLSRLLEQVAAFHYSTFRFYSPDRLQTALDTFQRRIRDVFRDCSRITFSNDHLLVVAQRTASA